MELLQLRYFAELAEQGNLSRTAGKLMISPPSLSSTMRKLEDDVGVPLFDRSQYRLCLNEKGRTFYHYVKIALNALDEGMASLVSDGKETLSLALTNFPVWAELIYAFEAAFPNVSVHYSLITLEELNDTAKPFLWDFFLGVAEDVDVSLFESRKVFFPETPVAFLSKDHPLANRETLRMDELKDEAFISTKMVNASAHHYMMELCHVAGFEPRTIYYADYLMRGRLLEQGRGVNIGTMVGWDNTMAVSERIAAVPIAYPILTRTQAVNWRKNRRMSATMQAFIEHAVTYLKAHPLSQALLPQM